MADYTVSSGTTIAMKTFTATETGVITFPRMYTAFRVENDTNNSLYFSPDGALTSSNIFSEDVLEVKAGQIMPIQYLKGSKKLYFYSVGDGVARIAVGDSLQSFRSGLGGGKIKIIASADVAPDFGSLVSDCEYRCTNSTLTTAPTFTLDAISSTSDIFYATVIYYASGATAPVITNNSGYTLKYFGDDVAAGTWTPVSGTVYRMDIVFDGFYINIKIQGVT